MDKSKGEPVISVKTKSKERVSNSTPLMKIKLLFQAGLTVRPFHVQLFCRVLFSKYWFDPFFRAQRAANTNHPVKRGKTSCPLTRSRSRGRGSGRDNERGRWEKWRGAGSGKIPAHQAELCCSLGTLECFWSELYASFPSVTAIATTALSENGSVYSVRRRRGNT